MRREPITHNIKIAAPVYKYLKTGAQASVVQFDDRDYLVGDKVELEEFKKEGSNKLVLTGDVITREITHIGRKVRGLMSGFVVLSLKE